MGVLSLNIRWSEHSASATTPVLSLRRYGDLYVLYTSSWHGTWEQSQFYFTLVKVGLYEMTSTLYSRFSFSVGD
jgi:hypothetical protein